MANTAQPNQPLSSHPLPFGVGRLLGASATLVKGAAPNSDSLLVPPPASSPNGSVARGLAVSAQLINNSAAPVLAGAGNFALVYKAEGALEAVFGDSANALAVGGTETLDTLQFLLAPTDRGVFLRLGDLQTTGPVDFADTLDAYMNYLDFRDRTRVAVDLTTDYQTVLAGVQGKSRMLASGGGDFSQLFAAIANFDSITHIIEARLSDGVNVIQLPSVGPAPIAIGALEELELNNAMANLQEGWSLQMRTTVAPALNPCRAILAYTDTNLSPVRTDQGGAY